MIYTGGLGISLLGAVPPNNTMVELGSDIHLRCMPHDFWMTSGNYWSLSQQRIAPWAGDDMPPADGMQFDSRCGSTSVRGRVRSPHISGGQPPAGSQRADSLGSCATQQACYSLSWAGVKLGRIPPDLRSGTSCLRSTTSNNRSCTSQLRSGTFLLGSTLCTVYI